jgi:hypothetical protein
MKFKCKHTGNIVEFTSEHDIKSMLTHPEYTVVTEETKQEVVKETPPKKK